MKFLDFIETHQLKNLVKITAALELESKSELGSESDVNNTFYSVIKKTKEHANVNDKLIWGK